MDTRETQWSPQLSPKPVSKQPEITQEKQVPALEKEIIVE
jgi:hypothetical protein